MKKNLVIIMCMALAMTTVPAYAGQSTEKETKKAENTIDKSDTKEDSNGILVAYYSASGNTKAVAEKIAESTDAEVLELKPTEEYTDDDLDYNDSESRVCKEYADPELRDIKLEETTVDDWDDIKYVFVGYPIWWGIAAWPVDNFIKENDFEGKTVIPFCTSASSGLGDSARKLEELAGNGEWQEGIRFSSHPSDDEIQEWMDSIILE